MPLMPEQIATWSKGNWVHGPPARIDGFSIDTRTLQSGQVFVALRTEKRDGHNFLPQAREQGASAAIVTRIQDFDWPQLLVDDTLAALQAIAHGYRRTFSGTVIAVTGSAGKTSTKEILALLLGEDVTHRTRANLNNHLGVPLTLLQIDPRKHRFAVVEAGISQRGDMQPLAAMCEPEVAVVTLVAPAHLEGLGTLDHVAQEKSLLVRMLRPQGWGIFPLSCALHHAFRSIEHPCLVLIRQDEPCPDLPPHFQLVQYSLTQSADATRLVLLGATPRVFHLPRVTPGMARNAALALLTASRLGVSDEQLQLRIKRWQPVAFRGQLLRLGPTIYYVDCYNANPASMEDAIGDFHHRFSNLPKIYVLGSMNELGPDSPLYHRRLGRQVLLGPNDRLYLLGEHAAAMAEGAREANPSAHHIAAYPRTEDLHGCLEGWPGAILLKASRSYRLEMLLPECPIGAAAREDVPC